MELTWIDLSLLATTGKNAKTNTPHTGRLD